MLRADEPHSDRSDATASAAFVLVAHEPSGGAA
jgi:hypothetical protein